LGIIIVALTIRVIVAASAANDFGKDSNNISIAWLVIGVIGVVLIAGFILLVSILFRLSLLMLYFYYFAGDYCQICIQIGTSY
jgi:hypothetical protein